MQFTTTQLVRHSNCSDGANRTQDEPQTCDVCAKIIACFRTPDITEDINTSIGLMARLLEGSCPHVEYFKSVKYIWGEAPEYEKKELLMRRWHDRTSVYFAWYNEDMFLTTADMNLVFRQDVPNHCGRALILDPKWMNVEVIRGWLSTCDRTHGDRCKSLPLFSEEDTIRPMYLIDTLKSCLVQGEDVATGYVALSYTWGQTSTLRAESKLLRQLQRPGVLAEGEVARKIPATIRDAFAVVRCLGQRYLWVDALCIVQDDNEQLEYELTVMHRIYACASFTIIAADGVDANHGLRGFKGFTAARDLRQQPVQLAASEWIMQDIFDWRSAYPKQPQIDPIYYTRAWTFQENIFSKRRLVFEKESIRWQCQCYEWDEALRPHEKADERWVDYTERWFHAAVPTLSNLSDIIEVYNKRTLTFPEDAFPAFVGIQSFLHRTYPSGLIYGHPEMFFDIALNWEPFNSVKRREASGVSFSETVPHRLPSWSWIGWAGGVALPWDHEFSVFTRGVIDIEGYTAPVTEWYTMEQPSATKRRRINSVWHEYKLLAQNSNAPLPPGWRREEFEIENGIQLKNGHRKHDFPPEIPRFCYKHSSFSHEKEFHWYPVPVQGPTIEYCFQPQTAYIFARTSRAYFSTGAKMLTHEFPMAVPPRLQLLESLGKHVGYLQLNHTDDLTHTTTELDHSNKRRVELVATCKGYTGKMFDHELAERRRQSQAAPRSGSFKGWETQLKDCYFVLWIEWKNGVAFRRGCGAVTVEAWESEREVELVDLIMG